MNKLYCLIIMFIACGVCSGQNLVPNNSFEQYSFCPNNGGQIDSCLFWMNPALITSATPDYYNSCAPSNSGFGVPLHISGYQPAHSGGAYAGIILWYSSSVYREYIEVPLISPLISNTCYHFEMYVSLKNTSPFATNVLGVYFSDTAIVGVNNQLPLPFIPQINYIGFLTDTLSWILITGNFTATGGENFLIIGNFNDDANTNSIQLGTISQGHAYYYIDDVSLVQIPPCNVGIIEPNGRSEIEIYPNPIKDKLTISFKNNELSDFILYEITSRKILQREFINSISINTEQLAKGIYLYEVRNKNGVIKKGKVVKD